MRPIQTRTRLLFTKQRSGGGGACEGMSTSSTGVYGDGLVGGGSCIIESPSVLNWFNGDLEERMEEKAGKHASG